MTPITDLVARWKVETAAANEAHREYLAAEAAAHRAWAEYVTAVEGPESESAKGAWKSVATYEALVVRVASWGAEQEAPNSGPG